LVETIAAIEQQGPEEQFELSEKYSAQESLIAPLDADAMAHILAIYNEEGWPLNSNALRTPAAISYYFAVFRDARRRKLLGVRRASQFKGIVKSRLIQLVDDSVTMVGDHVFKLDHQFD